MGEVPVAPAVASVVHAPVYQQVAYAPTTSVVMPATHSVIVAPPVIGTGTVQAGHVVMNGKTYASMEEAIHDYHGSAGHSAYTHNGVEKTTDAPLPEAAAAPVEAVEEAQPVEEAGSPKEKK